MKKPSILPPALLLLLLFALSIAQQQQTPPHIVLVIVDDAGIADTPFSNPSSPINTTRLASIAKEGIVLKEYYAHPTCTPSRAALMTGRYAHNTGLPFPLLATPVAGLATDIPTLPEVLKERGYATHMVGKWHLGHSSPSFTPLHRGFDSFFGLLGGGFDHYKKSSGVCTDLWRGDKHIPAEEINTTEHATVLFTNEAVDIINNHNADNNNKDNNKPLFLYLSYSAPHDPLQADEEYIKECSHIPHPTRRMFCAMMMQLDDNIGRRVRGALQERGMWDDTLFIFTSDNGGLPLVGGFNYPYRGTKSMAWEGGVRVPGFVKPPKSYDWPKGSEYSGLMHISDWMPTILSLVDNQDKKNDWPDKMDGVDMSTSLATNGESARLSVVPQLDVFLNSSAYRSGCLKLLLGCPGRDALFLEPEKYLLVAESEGKNGGGLYSWMIDRAFNLIERVIPPPLDQFVKYILYLQINVWLDWKEGTSLTHMLTSYQLDHLSIVDLKERPPVIEGGSRVFLYDVCTDPSERINLASSRPEEVKRLYEEFRKTFKDAPLQLAGDVVDPSAPRDGACKPWLPASSTSPATLTKNVEGSKRFFARLQVVLRVFVLVVVLLFVGAVATVVMCCRWRIRRQRSKQKKE